MLCDFESAKKGFIGRVFPHGNCIITEKEEDKLVIKTAEGKKIHYAPDEEFYIEVTRVPEEESKIKDIQMQSKL